MSDLKQKKDKLSWFINFLQMNLDNLSEREKRHLILSPMFWPFREKDVQELLSSPRGISISMVNKVFPPSGLKTIQNGLRKFFFKLWDQKSSELLLPLPMIHRALIIDGTGNYKILYPTILSGPGTPSVSIFISHFADLLNGLPKDVIRKCPGCEKFFVHISKKEKIYCSNQCAYKTIYRRRVGKLLENGQYGIYLDKQKRIMKKRYREEHS